MIDLAEVHHLHLNTIFKVCRRYTRDSHEADDLVQEVFLLIHRGLGSFQNRSQLGTWIYRVATNCCLDNLRRKKRRDEVYVEYLDSLVIRNLASGGDRTLAKIDLERILGHLRPIVRHTLFLNLAEGLSYGETAEVLGISRDAVAKTVLRFLRKFERERGRFWEDAHSTAIGMGAPDGEMSTIHESGSSKERPERQGIP